jgi:hypothetical protein
LQELKLLKVCFFYQRRSLTGTALDYLGIINDGDESNVLELIPGGV